MANPRNFYVGRGFNRHKCLQFAETRQMRIAGYAPAKHLAFEERNGVELCRLHSIVPPPIFASMKRIFVLLAFLATPLFPALAQDGAPATVSRSEDSENYKILKGRVDDLMESRADVQKRLSDLQSKVNEMSAQLAKPTGSYASVDDVKALKAAIEEVDKKRQADNEAVMKALNQIKELAKGAKTSASVPPAGPRNPPIHIVDNPDNTSTANVSAPAPTGPGFTYTAKPNDTLTKISKKLLQERGIKVSSDDILKANAFLKGKASNLKEGDKLFIPLPASGDTANK